MPPDSNSQVLLFVLRAMALTVYAFPASVTAGSPSDFQYPAIARNPIRSTGSMCSDLDHYLIQGRIALLWIEKIWRILLLSGLISLGRGWFGVDVELVD